MSAMRVLHVYRTYFPDPPGGLQEAIRQIARTTRDEGIEPKVFALSPSPRPDRVVIDGTEVIRARSWAAPASCDLGGVEAVRCYARAVQWADVIHLHYPWPFADVLNLVSRTSKPKVLTYHSDIIRQRLLGLLYRPLMHHTLRAMDRVVATSDAYARSSTVLTSCVPSDRLRIIPLGIARAGESSMPDRSVLARLGLHDHEPFVLFVGVLRYYKGIHVLLEAAARTRCRIVIAGSGPQGSNLKERARALELNNVLFAGQVTEPEKRGLIQACRAVVLPSHLRSEAFGMVLVEAAAAGRPMISCEIGTGTSFVNRDGVTGLVVPAEDPVALSRAIDAIAADLNLAERYGRAALERYDALFSGPAMGRAYRDLYLEVSAESRRT